MEKKKIGFWERVSYGCGDLGCNIIYSAMSAFLLFYYTDYVHVSAATVGTIMLFYHLDKEYDAVIEDLNNGREGAFLDKESNI